MKKNMSDIMTRAHAMTRAAIADDPRADYRVTLSAALRIAHAEYTPAAREEWESMTDGEKIALLERMTKYAYKRDRAACDRHGNERAPKMQWMETDDDFRAVEHEAYIRLVGYLAEDKYSDAPLRLIAYRAVYAAAQYIDRQERRNARAIKYHAVTSADGEKTLESYIVDNAAPTAEHIAPNPEDGAIIADRIDRAINGDPINAAIVRGVACGYDQRTIAAAIGVSQSTVRNRLAAIRAHIAE